MSVKSIILAAGQGTRMKSDRAKVLHRVLGKYLVDYPIQAARDVGASDICIVVGHQADAVKVALGNKVSYAFQKEQLGTGHGVMQAIDFIPDHGDIIVLYGDTPCITGKVLEKMLKFHRKHNNGATVLTAVLESPAGYDRVVRDEGGKFSYIVEQKDATDEEKKIKEVNGDMYIFKASALKAALLKAPNNNDEKQEYCLTDSLRALKQDGHTIEAMLAPQEDDIFSVKSTTGLVQGTLIMKNKINQMHMENGVTLMDPIGTYIEPGVTIGSDTIIEPGCMLKGNTTIGDNCFIGHNTKIENTQVASNVYIENSVIQESFIDQEAQIGPFAYIRPHSKIGQGVKIGDFVEIKNSTIGNHTKISHLTYVGDADVGEHVNFGCGSVLVNYDGVKKHRSSIGDYAFIGCNTNLVSPVNIGERGYTAAGSTITTDVPKESLGISRVKQVNKEGWVAKKYPKRD